MKAGADSMDLSIIIINWNSVAFLRKCLASVYANAKNFNFEVLVVDNASYDGCAELVASAYPSVRFFQAEHNLGFAGGNNLAAATAVGRNLLFLNSDTEVVNDALQRMLECIDSLPGAGAVGPKLLNSDGSIQVSCLQAFPSIFNHFVDASYLRRLFPRWSVWGNRPLFDDAPHPVPVNGIVGASLLIRRSLFEEVGGFFPGYFMYAEDMDLCYKVQQLGKTNYYVGTAQVVHHGGQSSNKQSDRQFSSIVMRESILRFMMLHRGRLYATAFQVSTAVVAVLRLGLLSIGLLIPMKHERKQSVRVSWAKWRRVFRWAIGLDPAVANLVTDAPVSST
jgi:GT2 family glycosyltransferase